jgi:UDP-glucose:(heptosyl)LPS alpha-1,3-glucosyltransferase
MEIFQMSNNSGIADHIRLYIEKKNYGERRYKKILAVSEGVKRELVTEYQMPPNDIEVIPNGVDCGRFSPRVRERIVKSFREKLKFSSDDFIMIFVANEFERKGLKYAIAALSYLRHTSVKLLVVGSDNASGYIRMAAEFGILDKVRFVGPVNDIANYYAISDAFVFPTLYEAFSLATLEAAASGLPLVATNVNGTEELIHEGVNGFFIERNAEDIANKLTRLIHDSELRKRLANNARTTAEDYSWDIIAKRTLEVYERARRR